MSLSGLSSSATPPAKARETTDQTPTSSRLIGAASWVAGAVLFALLATANGAGYRYGASDQAFYIPAIIRAANPDSFPRDGPFLDAEGRLMVVDDLLGRLVRTTGVTLESVSLTGYLLSLGVLWGGVTAVGRRLYRNTAATIALAAAFTLRHQISRTSANSFEPYFHPRVLAFGIGLLAIASLLRARDRARISPILLVALAALVHITTGFWFAVLIGVALLVIEPRLRRAAAPIALAGTLVCGWAIAVGPLRGGLGLMDAEWLSAVASKDTLFATDWPLWAWLANMALWGVLFWARRVRRRRGHHSREDEGLFWGATVLVALFLITLPAVALAARLVVQLQISRVFWLLDFLATAYALAALVETRRRNVGAILAAALVLMSAARGAYIMRVERPERSLFAVTIPDSPWQRAMQWLASQPSGIHVLADPGHAWKYGASVRVSPARDVFLEEVKDAALAIYSRDVAMRVLERTAAIGDFTTMTADRARALAARYDLDYLVTESELPLPEVYRNERFRIYALR